jgi:hypothetical protein
MADRIEIGAHHGFEPLKFRGCPAGIDPQHFCGQGKIKDGDAAQTGNVRARWYLVDHSRPGVQYPYGTGGIGGVAGDIPADGIEIGSMSILIGALAAGTHVGPGPMAIVVLGPGIGNEPVPAIDPGMFAGGHLGLHAVQVGLGVQAAGMYKSLGSCGLITKQPQEQPWEEEHSFHTEVFCGFYFLILLT